MKNFKTALAMENEIFKASDFNFGYNSIMENVSTAIKQILAGGDGNYVVGGAISPHPGGGLNLSIEPILAYCNTTDVCVVEGKTTGPVSLEEADSVNDRIDLVQIRGIDQPYDPQTRKFIDTSTGNEVVITQEVNTKKRIALDVMVKKGAVGHNSAPLVDEGYIKLAEVRVEAGTNNISQDAIKNISAKKRGVDNSDWTQEKQSTFNPGYLADVIHLLLAKHNEDGTLKDNSITASNIDFGTGSNQVKGSIIPVGEGVSFHGNTYTENDNVTQIIKTLASNVDSLYKYSNDLLSRYTVLNTLPVAASTSNIDIAEGGEKTIDDISCTSGQLVLLKNQTNPVENGLYTVQTGAWSRATAYDSTKPDALKHKLIFVKAGTVNKGKLFYLNGDLEKIGVDPLDFKESILTPYIKANSIMTRDENGRAKVEAPLQSDDIARLKEVDDAKTAITNAYKAADSAIRGEFAQADTDITNAYKAADAVLQSKFEAINGQSSHGDSTDGRNLLTVLSVSSVQQAMTKLSQKCNSTGKADFSDLAIGDYLDLPSFGGFTANSSYQNLRIVISGFNQYKGVGSTENTKNHILWTFKNCVTKRVMSSSGTNSGGYPSSELHTYLNGTFATALEGVLGSGKLYPVNKVFSTKEGYDWGTYKVFLPTEVEVWGSSIYGDDSDKYGTNTQFPIFQNSSFYRVKKYNGSRVAWWLASPFASGSNGFCDVDSYGGGDWNGASNSYGVAPAFCTC